MTSVGNISNALMRPSMHPHDAVQFAKLYHQPPKNNEQSGGKTEKPKGGGNGGIIKGGTHSP